jgi:hypothetical protein
MMRLALVAATAAVALLATDAVAQGGGMSSMAVSGCEKPGSPRDSLKVTVAGSAISVNYGRPCKRGREIFGGLKDMQWGMVWRTGANGATAFTTSKPLAFGARTVPAGSYTLYTLLEQSGKWELIVNKQTGQWGTEYNKAEDLVRIPLTVTTLPTVVEQMEITVTPKGTGGEIVIQWDKTRAAASFTVK